MKWAVGITTAPRKEETLKRCITSIQSSGWEAIRIFADGECPIPPGFHVTQRLPAAGAFSNWWLSMQELVCREPDANYYLIFQDDCVLKPGVRELVEKLIPSYVLSLFQSVHHKSYKPQQFEDGYAFVGALALIFPRTIAHKLVSSNLAITHRQRKKRNNDYIDGAIGNWCKENNAPLWIYGPSLAQHIGTTSTLGHNERPSATYDKPNRSR